MLRQTLWWALSTDLLGSFSEGSEPTTEDRTIPFSALSDGSAVCPVYDGYKYFLNVWRWRLGMRLEIFSRHPYCKLPFVPSLVLPEQHHAGPDWPVFTHKLSFKNALIRTHAKNYSMHPLHRKDAEMTLAFWRWQCYLVCAWVQGTHRTLIVSK